MLRPAWCFLAAIFALASHLAWGAAVAAEDLRTPLPTLLAQARSSPKLLAKAQDAAKGTLAFAAEDDWESLSFASRLLRGQLLGTEASAVLYARLQEFREAFRMHPEQAAVLLPANELAPRGDVEERAAWVAVCWLLLPPERPGA